MLQQDRMTRTMRRPRGHGGPAQRIASRLFFSLMIIAPLAGLAVAAVIEAPKPQTAQKYLGAKVSGPNYTVKPTVRSDGVMRIFEVDTSYGKFTFDGVEFTKLRLHELEAAAAIEKMSQSEAFGQAFGRAALGPIKFGADLLTKPADTVERSLSGIGNMLDRVGAGLSNTRADRDNVMESLLGVSDTQRQLAVDLDVDPYTDFPPLAEDSSRWPVRWRAAVCPSAPGLHSFPAVSASPFRRSRAWTLRRIACATSLPRRSSPKPSRPWLSLGIPSESIDRLVENRYYTPADLLIMARALKRLGAENTVIFVDKAAGAGSRNVAFYHRRRAQILAARSNELGGLVSFVSVGGQPVNVARNGTIVAAFTFDDIVWTDIQQKTFAAATAQIRQIRPGSMPVLAATGTITPLADTEIKKLGWKIVQLKPDR